jgi:hypothetical protein
MLFASVFTNLVGVLVFLFIFWKRLKDDFSSDIVFKVASYVLVGIFVGYSISLWLIKPYFLWFGFLAGIIGLLIAVYLTKVKFYETFESVVVASLPWIGFIFLLNSTQASSLSSFLGFLGILILVFISYFLDTHYKTFSWYKSGRIGFTGVAILFLIFLIRLSLAILKIGMLSFVSLPFELLLSGMGMVTCLVLFYNLSKIE